MEYVNAIRFIEHNCWLLLIMTFCAIWIIASIVILLRFKFYRTFDCTEGYTIKNVSMEVDAGLNFMLTFILPLLFEDLNCWQSAVVFIVIVLIIVKLLSKTNLFYDNPVLTILGYTIIRFEFNVQPEGEYEYNGEVIGICPKSINPDKMIKFKHISDNVVCIKQRSK